MLVYFKTLWCYFDLMLMSVGTYKQFVDFVRFIASSDERVGFNTLLTVLRTTPVE
jgi:hypothetical protein